MEIDFSPNVELEFGLSTTSAPDIEFGTGGVSGAIDVVKVNGTPLPIVNRTVDVPVPTKTSQLANDSNFATKSDIPKKTSQLTNDSGFITSVDVPSKTSQLQNDGSDGTDPFATVSQLPAPITVDSEINNTSTNPVQNQALYPAIVPTELYKTVYPYEWEGPAGTNLYDCVAILTMPNGTFTNNSLVELVNEDSFNVYAKHGFVLYGSEVASQRLWITCIGKPTDAVSLKFRIYKWGN